MSLFRAVEDAHLTCKGCVYSQLFWVCGGVNPRIEAAFLDGSDRHVLVDRSIQWPSSLAIDFPNRRLYWTDIKKRTIESVTLSGAYRKQVWKFAPG